MRNPGLKRHSYPMATPQTMNLDPPMNPVEPLDQTRRDDLETPPPGTGVRTPDPVSSANGAPPIARAATLNPVPEATPGASAARIQRLKAPYGGSSAENQAHTDSLPGIERHMDQRDENHKVPGPLALRAEGMANDWSVGGGAGRFEFQDQEPDAHLFNSHVQRLGNGVYGWMSRQAGPGGKVFASGKTTNMLDAMGRAEQSHRLMKDHPDFRSSSAPRKYQPRHTAGLIRVSTSDDEMSVVAHHDRTRGEFVYHIDDGKDYYLKDPPPSQNSTSNQSMAELKHIFDGSGDMPDVLDEAHHHPGWQGCQGCVDAELNSSAAPDDLMHQPGVSRDIRAHEYQPVEDLPRGERLAAVRPGMDPELTPTNWYEDDNLVQYRDPRHRPTDQYGNMTSPATDQAMIRLKDDPASGDPDVDAAYRHIPNDVCATCYDKYGPKSLVRQDAHGWGPPSEHEFKPMGLALGERYSAADMSYDHNDPLAAPAGGVRQPKRQMEDSDFGLDDDGWHRFGLMHPEGHDDNQHVTIAVRHHSDVPSPWGDKENIRPHFEVKVGKGENQVMPSNGGSYPYWGSALTSGIRTSHRDAAQGVAMSLGSDAQDIDLPLEHRSLYDHGVTEDNYPWAMGEGVHKFPVVVDKPNSYNSTPYSDKEKEFMREHADRLAKAGIEDYELNQTGEPSTLVNLDHHDEPESKPHSRYGAADWSNFLREASEDDPKGELEGLIGGLPQIGSPVHHTPYDQDHSHTLAEMGFGRHSDGDEPYWLRSDPGKDYVIAPGIEGNWETSAGPTGHWQEGSPDLIMPTGHTSFEEALEHMQVPPRAEPRRPGRMSPFRSGKPDATMESMSSIRLEDHKER